MLRGDPLDDDVTMTATDATETTETTGTTAKHFALAVLALATGGFAIGTTEFVTMGLLQTPHGVTERPAGALG